jgi:hypothetical protein
VGAIRGRRDGAVAQEAPVLVTLILNVPTLKSAEEFDENA